MNRVERRARDVVATWPRGARVAGLVPGRADAEWVGGAALALIRVAAEGRRPAFLLDLAPGASDLESRFDAAGAEGFGDAVAGEARLPDVARRDEEAGVVYLPPGRRGDGREIARSDALAAFAERVRRQGGVLLVVLGRESAEGAAYAGWPDGWVMLGEPEPAAADRRLPGELPELGRIEPLRARTADDGRWRRHRERKPVPTLKVAGAAVLLAALAGAWWWYAERVAVEPGGPGRGGAVAGADSGDLVAAGTGTDSALAAARVRAGAEEGAAATSRLGRRLEYSVLIASYASAADVRERVRELSRTGESVFFVAPTPVHGDLWYRVYAGARAQRAGAEALMRSLVEAGVKGEVREWDVRPVPWSFLVAEGLEERSRAEARAEELRGRGLPAYVLPGADGGYHVYSGAFESREQSRPLAARLESEGVDAELVRRAGGPR